MGAKVNISFKKSKFLLKFLIEATGVAEEAVEFGAFYGGVVEEHGIGFRGEGENVGRG